MTPRKRGDMSATALHEAEQHFDHLVAGVSDYAIFLLSPEGNVKTWNAGAERIEGYRPDEIIGRHFSAFYPPESVASGWPGEELAMAGAQGRFEDEGWRVRKDGSRFWANVVITAIRAADGELTGFLKITRDLTERRETEETLRQSEQRFRLLVEGVKEYAIFMLDPEGEFVLAWPTTLSGSGRLMGRNAAGYRDRRWAVSGRKRCSSV